MLLALSLLLPTNLLSVSAYAYGGDLTGNDVITTGSSDVVEIMPAATDVGGTATIARIERPGQGAGQLLRTFTDSTYIGGTGLTQKLPVAFSGLAATAPVYIAATSYATDHHRDDTSMAHNSSAVFNATFAKDADFNYSGYENTTTAFKIEAVDGWYGDTENIPGTSKAYLLAANAPVEPATDNEWWNVLGNLAYLSENDGGAANTALHTQLTTLGYTGYLGPKAGLNLSSGAVPNSKLFFLAEEPGKYKITYAVVDAVKGLVAESSIEISVLPRESRYRSMGNPLFPMWSHVPDTVPFVAEDPDNPGKWRLYWTGSHETRFNSSYCGRDIVMWSAPVEDLNDWTYHGVTSEVVYNRDNNFYSANGAGRELYAPDMTVVYDDAGKASYYFYPFPNGGPAVVQKSDRPDGPFTGKVVNWNMAGTNANNATGVIGTDPGVFWDPETKRTWHFQGIGTSNTSNCTLDELELDMFNRKSGTTRKDVLATVDADEYDLDPEHFRYYEAPSMHKMWFYGDTGKAIPFGMHDPENANHIPKYVMTYARRASTSENYPAGRPWAANQKAYVWSDAPDGPYTYGGVVIDASGEKTEDGSTAFQHHNTHGAFVQVNDTWYISYHRSSGDKRDSRQSVVEAIYPTLDLATGAVIIPEVEMTSMGFNTGGLKPYERYSAGYACYYTNGSYIKPDQTIMPDRSGPYSESDTNTPVVSIKDSATVGFKYFKFGGSNAVKVGHYTALEIEVVPKGVDGYIDVYLEPEGVFGSQFRPNEAAAGREIIATIPVSASLAAGKAVTLTAPVPAVDKIDGKRGLFFVFRSPDTDKLICDFNGFEFIEAANPASGTPVGIDIAIGSFDRFSIMSGEAVTLAVTAINADGSKADVTTSAAVNVTGAAYESGALTAGSAGAGLITATYNGFVKAIPFKVTSFLPVAGMITLNGKTIDNFSKEKFNYSFSNFTSVPTIAVNLPSSRLTSEVKPPSAIPGMAEVIVSDGANSATYNIYFRNSPASEYFVGGKMSESLVIENDNGNWRLEKGKGLVLPADTIGMLSSAAANAGPQNQSSSLMTSINNVVTLPAAGDWKIFAKIRIPSVTGNNNYEIGVYAWEDKDNFVSNRALVQGSGNSINLRKGVMQNGSFSNNKNAASVTMTDRVLYLGLEKCDNYYTALHSGNGRDFPGSDGRFGPFVTANDIEPQFAIGPVIRDVKFAIMASKANETLADQEFVIEYIAVQTADGERIMYHEDMLRYGVDSVLDYVANDIPGRTTNDLVISPVPTGYTLTVTSDKPHIISNTGEVVRPVDSDIIVNLTLTVSDGTRSASREVSVVVQKDGPPRAGAPNPYLPLWEHTPDGKPRLFQDPDDPTGTKKRVYLIASHDVKRDNYCSADIVAWSAPINDLTAWRYEGPVFTSYNELTNTWDRMFAPDMVEKKIWDPANPKAKGDGFVYEYYLYPHNISDDVLSFNGLRMNMVAKSDSPDGPFEVINWVDPNDRTMHTYGPVGFDPGVFIDYSEDEKEILGVYGFWGFQTSYGAELDPSTMYSLKDHTQSSYNSQRFSTESYDAMTSAVTAATAIYNDAAATQTQVDTALANVLDSMARLVKLYEPRKDPDALKAVLSIGQVVIDNHNGRYTAASITSLRSAMTTGESRINYNGRASTQAQIDTARDGIIGAIKGLEQEAGFSGPVNKAILNASIKRGESFYNTRPVDFMIPSNATDAGFRDQDETFPYVHDRAKEGRTIAQLRTAFNFFEASTIRKVGNKYVLVYSGTSGTEYGLAGNGSTLRYAFGDTPLGPWVDGGVLIDARAPGLNYAGNFAATQWAHNTHGSILEVPAANPDGSIDPDGGSQWYVFYHRPARGNNGARQASVDAISVEWDEKSVDEGGSVRIRGFDPYAENQIWESGKDTQGRQYRGAEVTSSGFNPYGLPPYQYYSAGIASSYTNNTGGSINTLQDAYDIWNNHQPVTNMQNNNILGFKYFDFENYTAPGNNTQFDVYLTPRTASEFSVQVLIGSQWEDRGGTVIGTITVPAGSEQVNTKFSTPVPMVDTLGQRQAIYLKVVGGSGNLCDFAGIAFSKGDSPTEAPPAPPTVSVQVDGEPIDFPAFPTNYTLYNGIYDYEVYEAYYPVPLTQSGVPVVTASCSDESVKISISQAPSTPGVAIVRFNKDGVFKSYIITFSPGAAITPAKSGLAYGNDGKYPGDIVELGKLKDLVAADKWDGDWEMWINVRNTPYLNAVDFTANTQAGIVITDATGDNYLRLNMRRQSATQVNAIAGWRLNGGAESNGTSRNFPASHITHHVPHYLRIVKSGNTLRAFSFSTDGIATNFQDHGAAQTFTPEFFENATVQAFATNASDHDLTSTIAIVPRIMGVHSTTHSTYELYTKDQIAVDATGIVIGDGIDFNDSDPGANAAEKMRSALLAKLNAAGTVTVKKATHSQAQKVDYSVDLSTFVFDEVSVTTAPGNEDTGPFTITIRAGNTTLRIGEDYTPKVPVLAIEITDVNKVTVEISNAVDANLYIASYGIDGKMIDLIKRDIDGGQANQSIADIGINLEGAESVKAFLWDENSVPLAEPAKQSVQ